MYIYKVNKLENLIHMKFYTIHVRTPKYMQVRCSCRNVAPQEILVD